MRVEPTQEQDEIVRRVLDAAFAVHRELGPGLLETVYEVCMADLLMSWGFTVVRQCPFPVTFMSKTLETGFRADIVVNDSIILEIKSIERLLPVHNAQLMTYLRLSGRKLGLLLNFNVPLMKEGIRRIVMSEGSKTRGALGERGVLYN